MAAHLDSFHYHIAAGVAPPTVIGCGIAGSPFTSNEAAARYYLDELMRCDDRPAIVAIVAPDRPERVPGLAVAGERDLLPLNTCQIRFVQTHHEMPVFGAGVIVELTGDRSLVSVTGQVGDVSGVDPVEAVSRAEALNAVAHHTGVINRARDGVGGRLVFYNDADGCHLAWFLPELRARPPVPATHPGDADGPDPDEGHGMGPRPLPPSYNFLVDAHDGRVLFAFSTMPTAVEPPVRCTGVDEDGTTRIFLGRRVGTAVLMDDPLRSVRTYDLAFAELDDQPAGPPEPVRAQTCDYGVTARAAVSAHVNVARVQEFYRTVLRRYGIDDQGMAVIALVNTVAAGAGAPPSLLNAFWWKRRMWYGQVRRDGRLVSLSRYLDIVAHELTHGVVETTSGLVYATQSGALNESFADIAGVIIGNWYTAPVRSDVATWTWEIGAGLRSGGGPLRDFADPNRFGHPAHMADFRHLRDGESPHPGNDGGWVHFNSSIHSKAVHNLLTLSDGTSTMFSVDDVAVLTYLAMARLTPMATFADALQAMVDVAWTYYLGSAERDARIDAIREAYRRVGIIGADRRCQPAGSSGLPA
jgi:Zn-dependent metalloprotease